jgi:N-methylhydantoinase A
LICADVGGTSTDVSLIVGGKPFVSNTFELEHDLVINALSTEIASVGAGGGSVVTVAPSGNMAVGPESVGSDPGPACYGRGGTAPSLTDACLLMGIIDGQRFAGGEIALDGRLARSAFESLNTPLSFSERIGHAFRIAASNVAEEIANVTIRHGVDPRDFVLIAYGAAGGMLLPATLDLLQVKSIIVPPHPGLFSALGLLSTNPVYYEQRSAYVVLTAAAADEIAAVFEEMETSLMARVGVIDGIEVRRSFDGRLVGQTWETPFVAVPAGRITADRIDGLIAAFHDEYDRRNGNRFPDLPVEGVTYRVEIVVPSRKVEYPRLERAASRDPTPTGSVEIRYLSDGGPVRANEYERDALLAGAAVVGPALIREPLSTTFVLPDQLATVGPVGELVIRQGNAEAL